MINLVTEPTVALISVPQLCEKGILEMVEWVKTHRGDCLPDEIANFKSLFPHDALETDAELLVELAGRKCYDSFGLAAGRKTNRDYIEHTQKGEVPHASILYHPKFSFFLAGISRRVSHELIRNYVGADRDQEGSPSQESTRFTHHYGSFVTPPRIMDDEVKVAQYSKVMLQAYQNYKEFLHEETTAHEHQYGCKPKGMDRKRIYEAAANILPMSAETSFIWTTNPVALAKLVREREHESADLEFNRLAKKMREVAVGYAPNLFPQPWMQPHES